jgi:hypothetical protein
MLLKNSGGRGPYLLKTVTQRGNVLKTLAVGCRIKAPGVNLMNAFEMASG